MGRNSEPDELRLILFIIFKEGVTHGKNLVYY